MVEMYNAIAGQDINFAITSQALLIKHYTTQHWGEWTLLMREAKLSFSSQQLTWLTALY